MSRPYRVSAHPAGATANDVDASVVLTHEEFTFWSTLNGTAARECI